MQNTEQNNDAIAQDEQQKQILPLAIMLSIDIESNFKLYSYRVIDHKGFLSRITDLLDSYNKNVHTIKTKF